MFVFYKITFFNLMIDTTLISSFFTHNFLKGREVIFLCSYRSTCFLSVLAILIISVLLGQFSFYSLALLLTVLSAATSIDYFVRPSVIALSLLQSTWFFPIILYPLSLFFSSFISSSISFSFAFLLFFNNLYFSLQ